MRLRLNTVCLDHYAQHAMPDPWRLIATMVIALTIDVSAMLVYV